MLAALVAACEPTPSQPPRTPPSAPIAPPSRAREPIDLPDFFAEGLAWDRDRSRLLLAGIVAQSIVAIPKDGKPATFAAPPHGWSVFGLQIDAPHGLVWAACAAVPQGRKLPQPLGRAGLLAFSLARGELVHERLTAADDTALHLFGDLALADDGRVYTTDTLGGGLYAATIDEPALRVVAPPGSFRSAQGIVVLDERTLVVADYSAGLVRVRLDAAGVASELAVLAAPDGVELRGIDGLAHRGASLAAVQNGTSTARILRVELAADASAIVDAAVLHTPAPEDGEPTLASIVDDTVWVVQTDRWDRVFDEGGRPREAVTIAPPVLLRLPFAQRPASRAAGSSKPSK
jgi:hypothetical protein